MERREAFERVLDIAVESSVLLNDLLLECQGKISDKDFVELRTAVGIAMGNIFVETVVPILNEFPELNTASKLRSPTPLGHPSDL